MKKLLENIEAGPLFFKFDLKMKLTTIFLLVTLLNVYANGFSQKNKVTLKMDNVTVLQVINEIEASTAYRFVYKIKDVGVSNKISIQVTKERIEKVLDILFLDSPVQYKILNEQIVLKKSDPSRNGNQLNHKAATQKKVSGIVRDSYGTPLVGVTVLIKDANVGTSTDFDGFYQLNLPDRNSTLTFSYVGFFTETVAVNGQSEINVTLKENTEELQEVVVQAYRNTTSVKNASAISTISSETVENKPNISVLNSLQAQVPGLSVSSGNGQPGFAPSISIRGIGSINGDTRPLFVIDGTPVDSFDFRGINPNDIDNISILKDAAASGAYGNRGANGVILITTKKGKYESGLEITYTESYGRSTQQENNYGLMNSLDLLNLQKELGIGRGSQLSDEEIRILANQNNTDWTDFIFREGESRDRQLSLSFGGKNSRMYTSFSHSKQEGIVRNTGLERYTIRTNISGKTQNNKFNYGVDLTGGFTEQDVTTDLGSGLVFFNPIVGAIWGQPFLNPFRPDGTVNDDSFDSFQPLSASPYVILNNFRFNPNKNEQVKSVINTNASYEIINNLRINGRFGIDYLQNNTLRVIHPESTNRLFYPVNGEFQGRQIERFFRDFSYNANASINYKNTFGLHSIDASAFVENYKLYRKSFGFVQLGLDRRTFAPGDGDSFVAGDREENGEFIYIPSTESDKGEGGLLSYFAIVDYDYNNKYGVSATVRRDGSFRFSKQNRWGTFYSISARWNIDQEDFIGSDSFINRLKLRASYGSTGSERIGGSNFLSLPNVSRTLYTTGTGYNNTTGLFIATRRDNNDRTIANLGNSDITWETTDQANIGIDYGFFQNRLRGSLDVYNKITSDLFIDDPVSAINGAFNINSNQGKLRNRGAEFYTEYDIVANKNLTVTFKGNIAYNENEVLELSGGPIDNGQTIIAEGHPISAFYLVPYVGVNPANGNALYRTKDGEITEVFNADDRVIIDSSIPKVQGGFGANIDYKGIFLQSNFSFVGGVERYNDQQRFFQTNPREALNFNVSANYNRAWTPENRITDVEGLFSTRNNSGSDKFLHDASYIRLRYIGLGYNFTEALLERLPIKALRVYLQAENLLTWSKWQGLDVEANNTRRFDFSNYPTPRIFKFGMEVKF